MLRALIHVSLGLWLPDPSFLYLLSGKQLLSLLPPIFSILEKIGCENERQKVSKITLNFIEEDANEAEDIIRKKTNPLKMEITVSHNLPTMGWN